jgi:hypothetical protein
VDVVLQVHQDTGGGLAGEVECAFMLWRHAVNMQALFAACLAVVMVWRGASTASVAACFYHVQHCAALPQLSTCRKHVAVLVS